MSFNIQPYLKNFYGWNSSQMFLRGFSQVVILIVAWVKLSISPDLLFIKIVHVLPVTWKNGEFQSLGLLKSQKFSLQYPNKHEVARILICHAKIPSLTLKSVHSSDERKDNFTWPFLFHKIWCDYTNVGHDTSQQVVGRRLLQKLPHLLVMAHTPRCSSCLPGSRWAPGGRRGFSSLQNPWRLSIWELGRSGGKKERRRGSLTLRGKRPQKARKFLI